MRIRTSCGGPPMRGRRPATSVSRCRRRSHSRRPPTSKRERDKVWFQSPLRRGNSRLSAGEIGQGGQPRKTLLDSTSTCQPEELAGGERGPEDPPLAATLRPPRI